MPPIQYHTRGDLKLEREEEGKSLLQAHDELLPLLKAIPASREMLYREEEADGHRIGKPRFNPPEYLWPSSLQTKVHDHLERVWRYFDHHSYWFDDAIRPILEYDSRRLSNKSVVFLLEHDVWGAPEVYGDYLIEPLDGGFQVSYYRRNARRRTFEVPPTPGDSLEDWIKRDAVRQVTNHFVYLWTKLRGEIEACIEEEFHPPPRVPLDAAYLSSQYIKTQEITQTFPEAALLSLGRLAELWLMLTLGITSKGPDEDLIRMAYINAVIDESQGKFLRRIRTAYNHLKHDPTHRVQAEFVAELVVQFSPYIKS